MKKKLRKAYLHMLGVAVMSLIGLEWSVRGASTMIALRCALLSEHFADFWESRAA